MFLLPLVFQNGVSFMYFDQSCQSVEEGALEYQKQNHPNQKVYTHSCFLYKFLFVQGRSTLPPCNCNHFCFITNSPISIKRERSQRLMSLKRRLCFQSNVGLTRASLQVGLYLKLIMYETLTATIV